MGSTSGSPDTFNLGGDLSVRRLGFGSMRLTGTGVWGWPKDIEEARRVLRRVTDLGINFIDTADSYGPEVAELLIADALHPYPSEIVIATKGGFVRTGPNQWITNGHPQHLKAACEDSLRQGHGLFENGGQTERVSARLSLECPALLLWAASLALSGSHDRS